MRREGLYAFLRRDDYVCEKRSFYYNTREISILFRHISHDITNISNLELKRNFLTKKKVKKVLFTHHFLVLNVMRL